MRRVDCPICLASGAVAVWRVRGSRTGRPAPLYRCSECDSYFQRTDYREDDKQLREDLNWHVEHREDCMREAEQVLEQLLGLAPKAKSLLDIGCGTGSFISVAQRRGLSCDGIEPNPHAVGVARESGLTGVKEGFFPSTSFDGRFDLVIIDSVLEHVPDPSSMIRGAVEALSASGLLYISVPGRVGGVARIAYSALVPSSRFSLFADNDVHINHFSRRAMLKLVDDAGGELRLERAPGQYVFARK